MKITMILWSWNQQSDYKNIALKTTKLLFIGIFISNISNQLARNSDNALVEAVSSESDGYKEYKY